MIINKLKHDQRLIRFFIAGVLFAVIVVSIFLDPLNYSISNCAIKQMTGYSCPTCGLTRSFHAGANLNITQAFAFHIIGPLLLLSVVLLFVKFSLESATGKAVQLKIKHSITKIVLLTIGIIWVLFWIWKVVTEIP
jgi:hypothetical protein